MRPPPARDPPRALRLALLYALAHAGLAAASLAIAAAAGDAYGVSRAALQLASALSLLPAAAARRRRAPTLAALAAALALFIDAVLRALAALHQIVHGSGVLRSSRRYTVVAGAQAALSAAAAAAAAPRALPYQRVVGVKRSGPPSTQPQSPTRFPAAAAARRRDREDASAADLGLLLVLLHAVSCVAARAADVVAAVGRPGAAWPAFVDACAASVCMALLVGPIRMLCRILLQATPDRLVSSLRSRLETVAAIDGVLGVSHAHFWEETPGVCVGTVALTVSAGVKSSAVVRRARNVFASAVEQLTIQVEEIPLQQSAVLSSDAYAIAPP